MRGTNRMVLLAIFAVLGAGNAFPHEPASTPERSPRGVWDLSSLFRDDSAWDAERAAVISRLEKISRLKGTLGRGPRALADGLDEIAELRRRAGKLDLFGVLRSDSDIQSEKASMMAAVGPSLANQVDAAVAYAGEEIRAVGEGRLREWLKVEPRLEIHRRRIFQALREGPHSSGLETQSLVRDLGDWPDGLARTYWALLESDLPWPTMKDADGHDVVVNSAAFLRLRYSANSGERTRSTDLFLHRIAPLENIFGVLLTRRIQADATIARHRGFRDGIEAQLFREGMPPETRGAMLDAVQAGLPVLQRYLRLRARVLGLERLGMDTIRVAPPGTAARITAQQRLEAVVAASAPLGSEFQRLLRERLRTPWIHWEPSPAKRDTYEIFPRVGGSEPFGLMTFRDDLPSSRALAGLATLMVTFAAVPPERSFDRWEEDTGIFSNAILEAGRFLHDDYMIEHAASRAERIAALVNALDSLGGVLFRYALISEFESSAQEAILAGQTPTGSQLSKSYLSLLRTYYGHEASIVDVDEMFSREWITNRVSFLSFETLNFPLAAAAGASLVEKAREGSAVARGAFLRLLGRGDIDLSYPLLKQAGVDLASSAPYQDALRRMRTRSEELAQLLATKD